MHDLDRIVAFLGSLGFLSQDELDEIECGLRDLEQGQLSREDLEGPEAELLQRIFDELTRLDEEG